MTGNGACPAVLIFEADCLSITARRLNRLKYGVDSAERPQLTQLRTGNNIDLQLKVVK